MKGEKQQPVAEALQKPYNPGWLYKSLTTQAGSTSSLCVANRCVRVCCAMCSCCMGCAWPPRCAQHVLAALCLEAV